MFSSNSIQTLDDVVGQETVIEILNSVLKSDEFHRIFLFYGPSGTGKSLIADYLVSVYPTTKILEEYNFPVKWDIVLKWLDNNLQKRLIVCTTDINSVDSRVKSRALHLAFKLLTPEEIINHLKSLCGALRTSFPWIANRANGDLRQALIMLWEMGDDLSRARFKSLYPEDLDLFSKEFFSAVLTKSVEDGRSVIKNTFSVCREVIPMIDSLTKYLADQAENLSTGDGSSFSDKFILRAIKLCWDARMKVVPGSWSDSIILESLFLLMLDGISKLVEESSHHYDLNNGFVNLEEMAKSLE